MPTDAEPMVAQLRLSIALARTGHLDEVVRRVSQANHRAELESNRERALENIAEIAARMAPGLRAQGGDQQALREAVAELQSINRALEEA